MRASFVLSLGLASLVGCSQRPIDVAEDGESSDTSPGDGDPGDGDPGDGDPGDGDPGDGDPGDGDPGDGDGDGDPNPCEPAEVWCPDDSCQWDAGPYTCCAHAGACARGCEPQDAFDPTPAACDEPGEFAWDGEKCRALCECDGADCGALFPSARACLEAHDAICGNFDFDLLYGPTQVDGDTPLGTVSYRAGVFGLAWGKGQGDPGLVLRLGYSELELGNYIAHHYTPTEVWEDVLSIDGAPAQLGAHEVFVDIVGDWQQTGIGTLTITNIDTSGVDHGEYLLEATLELMSGSWALSGPIAVHGCVRLDVFAP